MRLELLEVYHFKQYYGEQTIEFAGAYPGDTTNVTVIHGENGKGKTTLYRAILFALFGDTYLQQDEQSDHEDGSLYLCNLVALEESEENTVYPHVRLVFTHDAERYEIKRSIVSYQLEGGKIDESIYVSELFYSDRTGVTHTIDDHEKIQSLITPIMDPRMKSYFLFDGERIEQLTRGNQMQRKEVGNAFRSMMNVDALHTAINVAKRLRANYQREIHASADGEYKKKLKEQEEKETETERLTKSIESLREELAFLEHQKHTIDQEHENNKEIREKALKRKQLEQEVERLENEKRKMKEKIREFHQTASLLVGGYLVEEFQADVERKWESVGTNIHIPKSMVQDFIDQQRCGICNTEARESSKQIEHLKVLLESIAEDNSNQLLAELQKEVSLTKKQIEDNKEKAYEIMEKFTDITSKISNVKIEIRGISEEIGEVTNEKDISEFEEKEKARDNIISKIAKTEARIVELERDLKQGESKKKDLDKEVEALKQKLGLNNEKEQLKEFSESLKEIMEGIRGKFISEMAEEVSEVATTIYRELIDEDSRKNLKKVVVKGDFSLEVISWARNDFLANISAGQRQILSISFILALLRLAGNEEYTLDVPLFMDTPFGRISGTNRDNLLAKIPNMASQWILLVTDTEMTKAEAKALRQTGKWGKVYRLLNEEEGKAIAKPENVSTFVPAR